MPVSADTLRVLIEKGLSGDDLIQVVAAIDADMERVSTGIPVEKVDAVAERRRAYDRERKRNVRRNSTGLPPDTQNAPLSIGISEEEVREESKREAPAAKRPPDKRGTRLPEDWMPTEADAKYAASLGYTAAAYDREVQKFCNHWHSKPGKDGSKLNWTKTFHNWLLRGAERFMPRDAYRPTVQQTTPATFVVRGSPQWQAWTQHRGREPIVTYHGGKEGQFLPTEWPPQQENAA